MEELRSYVSQCAFCCTHAKSVLLRGGAISPWSNSKYARLQKNFDVREIKCEWYVIESIPRMQSAYTSLCWFPRNWTIIGFNIKMNHYWIELNWVAMLPPKHCGGRLRQSTQTIARWRLTFELLFGVDIQNNVPTKNIQRYIKSQNKEISNIFN